MPTNLDPTGRGTATRGLLHAVRARLAAVRERSREEEGFLLIEVVISAVLVALIVVGTFNGFDVANRLTTAERQHEQAALLAAASQEQLRSDPASFLQSLQSTPHSYTQTVQGTVYTIKQSTELRPAGESTGGCDVSQSGRQSGNAYRITSTVSWKTQEATKRPPVAATSLVTPPIGSSLEIDVLAAPAATAGVSGVTGTIRYTPEGTKGTAIQTQTTGSEGCLLFGALPTLEAEVEIAELLGYVTPDGKGQVPNKTVTIAPNYTVHDSVVYNRAGAIQANYNYSGAATAKHQNNEETAEVTQTVTGDTFVALNTLMEVAPNFELGSTSYGAKTTIPYEVKTGTFQASATSKTNLFPFTAEESGYWGVYAGDCTANNPETVTGGAIKPQEHVTFKPGETASVAVPTSYTTLNVYSKKESEVSKLAHRWEGLETANPYSVLIDNLGCTGVTPVDETAASYQHAQTTTTGSSMGGHLSSPFQPFGKEFTLCLANVTAKKTYKVKYANTALTGGAVNIYLPQRTLATVVAERKAKETAYKADKTAYEAAQTKYKEYETKFKEKKKAYEEKEAFKEQNKVAETKKKEFETRKKEFETRKKEFETAKKKYEETKKKYEEFKKKYEETKKASYKTEYVKYETEYKSYEKEYKTLETEYKTLEGQYKTLEAEYKTAEKQYEEWAKPHSEYETYVTKYNEYFTEYQEELKAYETDFPAYKAALAEETEATSVTVTEGTSTCT